GFVAVNGAALSGLALAGAWPGYWDEVWRWGRVYAAAPPGESPLRNGLIRTVNWAGFHAALVVAAVWLLARRVSGKGSPSALQWAAWYAFSLAGVAAGWRFFPRYYFLLLPVLVVTASHGFSRLGRRSVWAALLLVIPVVRFGPR